MARYLIGRNLSIIDNNGTVLKEKKNDAVIAKADPMDRLRYSAIKRKAFDTSVRCRLRETLILNIPSSSAIFTAA